MFKPAAAVGKLPLVMLVSKQSGIGAYADLDARAKQHDPPSTSSPNGSGSRRGLIFYVFPTRGPRPRLTDLCSGEIQIMVTTSPTALIDPGTGCIAAI